MKKITLTAKTEVKDEKQLERANEYAKAHDLAVVSQNEKSGKTYLVETFDYDQPTTFSELTKKYKEEEILSKFNEIRVIRLQDSKRNLLKASIEDKQTSDRALMTAIQKASGLSPSEIAEKLGITI